MDRMMAFVANLPDGGQRYAIPYYQTIPSEPVQPAGFLPVGPIFPLGAANVYKLLAGIAHNVPKNGNVLIVSHGTGGGLNLPLTPNPKGEMARTLGVTATEVLNKYANGSMTDKDAADQLDLLTDDAKQLKEVVLRVRQIGIDKLVIRACDVGRYLATLENLRRLFGASSACAPDVFDVFGHLDLGNPVADIETFTAFTKSDGVIVDGSSPNRFAWSVSVGNLKVKAESQRAVMDWVSKHFPQGNFKGKGAFAYHGLSVGNRLPFPKDPEYRTHLKQVSANQKP